MKRPSPATLAGALRGFLTDFLPCQRALSPHTLQSYRDSLKLLLKFAAGKNGDPSALTLEQLTVDQVTAFLHHLESKRNNRASTRNVRLSAIHSFFRYVGTQHPEHLAQTQRLLGIPFKRTETREDQHLEFAEPGEGSEVTSASPKGHLITAEAGSLCAPSAKAEMRTGLRSS